MAEFDENDLVHQDYDDTVTPGDNPHYTAIRDRVRVSKKEQYEVVWFCNAYLNDQKLTSKASFQKVERIIRLPKAQGIVMRDELYEFVLENWDKN